MQTVHENELWQLKSAMAAIATCIVETMNTEDPTFKDRFLGNLEKTYSKLREGERENLHMLESFNWTREFLTGWSMVSGQGHSLLG